MPLNSTDTRGVAPALDDHAGATYRLLIRGSDPEADPFDVHVAACVFALALSESSRRKYRLPLRPGSNRAVLPQ